MQMAIYHRAKRFFPKEYEKYEIIKGRAEIVAYDIMLCEHLHTQSQDPPELYEQLIAYFKNPTDDWESRSLGDDFEFCGYDLVEEFSGISAITNCADMFDNTIIPSFDNAIPYDGLNKYGLISTRNRAFEICNLLEEMYPDESHADCDVYEIWRKI
jgi:hypothetical protein